MSSHPHDFSTHDTDETGSRRPFELASREHKPSATIVRVGDLAFGGKDVVLMAGPCAVESEAQVRAVAARLSKLGIKIMRGGAVKPRTSPYAFQGLGVDGYRILKEAAAAHGMKIVSEVLSERHVEAAVEHVDLLQVGSRNMQNFALLRELSKVPRPVLLKRGMSATYDELLAAAEYLLAGGNPNVILCERGIRTFETATRNTLDIAAVPALHALSHLPVVVDPSHAAGRADLVPDLLRASIAAGADGILLEVHVHPEDALSDGAQAIVPTQLERMLPTLSAIAQAIDRRLVPHAQAAELTHHA
ncbi:MAG: 3-deoxy-7-phosphoheptulonate synthase [Planctomycetes bacterium]|nr:3-deoxy-7-phosphoheptulonate synthase [Planctomycetota bacterium]MCC7169455.1 3-deoxy-7-phosphoheptulonate synthase [Planctomycetota bacterium]